MQSWTRMAGSLVLALLLLLQGATALRSVREKQIKLEDIERDNLQTELLKQQRVEQHQQHPAYQQAAQQAAQQAQQVQQEHEQAYHQHYQPQHHFRYEQAPLQHHHHPHHQLAQQHHQQQQLLYQAAAAAGQGHAAQGVVPTHIMYLIMPNGNVAAFQLAPHPNHIQQAYYSPSAAKHQQLQLQQAMLGTLYHQHAVQPALQYYQPQYVAAAAPTPAQRYLHQQPAAPAAPLATVHHQPTLSFTSQQAHQLHAQHFRELSEQPASSAAEYASAAAGPEQQLQLQQQQHAQAVQQSHKSLYGAGVKATASPPLKGSFSTQTGQSYANFRQYG